MIFKKKMLLSAIAAALLTVSASAAFEKTNTYTDGQFSDIPTEAWYASEVKSTYELGLMNGTGGGLFLPEGNVTVAEAITMASRASAAFSGETIASADGEWYQMYVNYAVSKGFVEEGKFDNFDRPAKRYEVAEIFANAMPDGYFTAVNDVMDIHDVPDSREYKDELLTLYNAGVVMGSDAYGTFNPEYSITRAEAAAIINRVALPENRLNKELLVISEDDAFYLCSNSDMNSEMSGINSGWLLDNRGGVPRSTLLATYASTTDISTTEGTALIREFNKTSTGNIRLYSEISIVNPDGFYFEYQNDEGKTVYRAEIVDGVWNVLTKDGYTPVYEIANGESMFKIEAYVDLDNCLSSLYINGKACGSHELPVEREEANLLNFRYATTDEGTPSYRPQLTSISSNYLLDEGFSKTDKNTVPRGWTADEVVGATGELQREYLSVPGGKSASYGFNPVGGLPIAEFNFILPENEKISYTLKSGSTVAVEFTADESGFYVNGNCIYDEQYKNIWYRMRLELDTDTQTVFVRFNGRDRGTYPLANAVTSVNNFTVVNNSETPVGFDNFRVFKYIEHEDYVPEPVVPEGSDDYKIGMNVCSLWRNGGHFGWACITPFDDPQPVLGYYDENLPETADWEIKYLVEHGIDFQAFCLFFYWNEPFNLGTSHLTEGFMNAKYSDMSEFC
ncbi:MAG: S-layer homology domain-containing protein, partial [Clostridia bacterium]|nr:S-layer homology domain-containing protein [Clostridia bacterium]